MALQCGIVGLPNVGKSTLFNCLSNAKAQAANFPFCTIEPNVGVITVPDERLTKLAELVNPRQIVPTTVEIVDIAGGRVLSRHLVAHGSGSDPANSGWVQRFSNVPGSNASSPGSFLTGQAYSGKHGRSRRLIGLDPENSLALPRNIVIHGARYVSHSAASNAGRIGRSQGCFAVPTSEIDEVLELLGPGRLLYAAK